MVFKGDMLENVRLLTPLVDNIEIVLFHTPTLHNIPGPKEICMLKTIGEQEDALLNASRLSLNMAGIPQGPNHLHWYANPDGIYLFCTQVGCLSKLSGKAKSVTGKENIHLQPTGPQPPMGMTGGTMVMDGQEGTIPSIPDSAAGGAGKPARFDGTMIISGEGMEDHDGPESAGGVPDKRLIKQDPQDAIDQDRRLQYLCRLIRRQRQPLCPINGVVTLLPFTLIQRSVVEAIEVQRALKRDLATLVRVLELRCPATALVVGMEEEIGFQELVRRVGPERAEGNRFGKGYSASNPPLAERMEALCIQACGSFEDWIYALFREKGALTRPGNTRLYSLLVKIRRKLRNRLADILAGGFGIDDEQDQRREGLFFGGCYFAATGNTEDRRAFVKGVFDKLPQQQEELQWTEAALCRNQKIERIANLVLALGMAMLLLLAGVFVYKMIS